MSNAFNSPDGVPDTGTPLGNADNKKSAIEAASLIFNIGQGLYNNWQQRQENQRQRNFSHNEAVAAFDREAAYNNPIAVMQRLAAAGVSPYSMTGQDMPDVSSPYAAAPPVGDVGRMPDLSHDFNEAALVQSQVNLNDARADEARGHTFWMSEDAKRIMSVVGLNMEQIDLIKSETRLNDSQIQVNLKVMADYDSKINTRLSEVAVNNEKIDNLKASTCKLNQETDNLKQLHDHLKVVNPHLEKQIEAEAKIAGIEADKAQQYYDQLWKIELETLGNELTSRDYIASMGARITRQMNDYVRENPKAIAISRIFMNDFFKYLELGTQLGGRLGAAGIRANATRSAAGNYRTPYPYGDSYYTQ